MKPASLTIARGNLPLAAGWLVTCPCGFERWCGTRSAADRVAHDHIRTHGKGER